MAGTLDNYSGSPMTSIMPQTSSLKIPDFRTSLQMGSQMNLGQGLGFPTPSFLQQPQPYSQSDWASQQFQNRLDNQQQQFSQRIQDIWNPQKPDFDPTAFGLPDWTADFANKTKPMLQQAKMQAGLVMQKSGDKGTQLLGQMQTQDAMNETLDSAKEAIGDTGASIVNEGSMSFGDKFANSTFGKNFGMWSAGIDMANSVLTGILGEKSEYSGTKGDLARGIDSAYDQVSDAIAMVPGFGQAASLIMKGGKALGAVTNKLGGGTDGMTTADAILGSAFLNLTPFGLINGFGGSKAATIKKDDEIFETVGSSYTGTGSTVDDALTKSGKKYGLFSSSARKQANREIFEARRQQDIMRDISDEATNRFAIRNSMSAINGNRRAFAMHGGYDQASVRAGKHGLSFKTVSTAKRIVSAYKFKHSKDTPVVEEPIEVPIHKEGGVLSEISFKDIPTEFLEESIISEVSIDDILPEFKEGGKVNVIPEGALHARLHHMENADNLTKKGIPVVAEKEGGELEQQAEIEREEIIFRLEVTQQLEELQKKFQSDEYSQKEKDEFAIEAGKLLAHEILNNTIDNTNNLL